MNDTMMKKIKIVDILVGDRHRKDYKNLPELKASITEVILRNGEQMERGLINPIAVMRLESEELPYKLLAGGRRLAACTELEHEFIDAKVFPPMDEYDSKSIELVENIHRDDLSYPEECSLIEEINDLQIKKFGQAQGPSRGTSMRSTAELLGKGASTVTEDINLSRAIKEMPELGKCKNKTEAKKMFAKVKQDLIRSEIAKRNAAKIEREGVDSIKSKLIENYIVGDFFKGVVNIPTGSISLIDLDPPFGIGLPSTKKETNRGLSTKDYHEVDIVDYIPFMEEAIDQCYRVLQENGWLLLWFALEPWAEEMYQMLTKAGFDLFRVSAIWTKGTGQCNWPEYRLGSSYETFYYARKGNALISRQGRSNAFDYRPIAPQKKVHPTEKPIELMQDVLATFCPPAGVVFVPFLGSGNTLLAASNLGMRGFGYDLSQTYKDSYIIKVAGAEPGEYRSYI